MLSFKGHSLVMGATGAGKGVFSAMYAEAWQRRGGKVFLLCNKQDEYEDFPADFKTMKQERLIEEVKKLKAPRKGFVDTLVVIDEAWDWKWKGDGGLQVVPLAARSMGVEMLAQTQFPTQMPPGVRGNCQNIYCFLLQEPAALDWVSKSFHKDFGLVGALRPGQYIAKRGLDEPFAGVAWFTDENGNFRRAAE